MDVSEAVETRIEIRSYRDEPIDDETTRAILNAGRLASSGRNLQHWRFILLDDDERLAGLAQRSPTGPWVADAAVAIVVCTDPAYDFHEIDAGRAVTHMQLVAWEHEVGSCIFTIGEPTAAAEYLAIPDQYDLTLVAAFGYPERKVQGKKDRKQLSEIASSETFGSELQL